MSLNHTGSMHALPALFAAAVAATSGIHPTPTHAQEKLVLEEILVTARRRQESLQETPVAVSAFSGDDLEKVGITNLADFRQVVPNMDVANGSGANSGVASIFIRGVGQRNAGVEIDSGVGLYLDGVYIARSDGALLDMVDMASVQVLRGPQGTLFGKNTTGGAVLFNTVRPQEEFGGKILARLGNYDRTDVQGVLNVPLSDTLLTRFSAGMVKRDGYMKNIVDGEEYSDEDRTSAQGQLRWLASDAVTVDLNMNYSEIDQLARGQKCQNVDGYPGWNTVLNEPLLQATYGVSGDALCDESEALDTYKIAAGETDKYESDATGVSATIDWQITDSLSLKSITAWRNTDVQFDADIDATRAPLLGSSRTRFPDADGRQSDQYSQEFQVLGEALDGSINWQAGAFFFREESENSRANVIGPFTAADLGPDGVVTFLSSTLEELETKNTAWAVFGQADWAFADNWELTAGLRYTDEERESFNFSVAPFIPETITTGPFAVPINPPSVYLIAPDSLNQTWEFAEPTFFPERDTAVSNDEWTPSLSIKYLFEGEGFINNGSAYLSYSRGFLSGGIGQGLIGPAAFKPEEVTNYELGLKLDAWERRLRINAALFYTDYENRQLTAVVVNPFTNGVQALSINAKKSSISGLELETTLLATENLQLTINATWNDDEIDEFEDEQIQLNTGNPACTPGLDGAVESCPVDRSDERLPRIPESSYYVAAQYNLETSIGTFIPRVSWSLIKDVEQCFDRGSCVTGGWLGDIEDLSARFTWISPDTNWQVTAYGTNLQDKDFVNGGNPNVDTLGWGGATITPPRMYGVELHYYW